MMDKEICWPNRCFHWSLDLSGPNRHAWTVAILMIWHKKNRMQENRSTFLYESWILICSCMDSQPTGWSVQLVLCITERQPCATKLPPYAGSRGRVGRLRSIVRSLTLHFCKRLFPRLEPMTSWSQGSNPYHCAKAPPLVLCITVADDWFYI